MDKDSIERIRTATFSVARRGYDKRQVDRFLEQVAEWLETGGADDARSELVRAELERVGEQTAAVLVAAHDAAEGIRTSAEADIQKEREEAQRYASGLRAEADAYSERAHIEADEYAQETRGEADAHAARIRNEANAEVATTREDATAYAETVRAEADEDAAERLRAAESQAHQMLEDATRRKAELQKVIDDLAERRQAVIADMQRLSSELVGTATQHEAAGGPVAQLSGATEEFAVLGGEEDVELEDDAEEAVYDLEGGDDGYAEEDDSQLDDAEYDDAEYEDAEQR
jgi:DivIVA domain-containing protein